MFIPKEKIEWRKVKYLKIPWQATDEEATWLYELWLNEPLASWDVFAVWEVERVLSMREHLKRGDVLFDIGAEQGWCDLAYAHIVGPENMVLVEPSPDFWPNIRALWEKNFSSVIPLACFAGFFSDRSTNVGNNPCVGFWPEASEGDLIDRNSYKNLSDESHAQTVSQISIDDFVKKTNIKPAALTIDVEGAEYLVLSGARETLKNNDLKVWVSVHDDLAKDYLVAPEAVDNLMSVCGYEAEHLATDHEKHIFYSRKK